MVVVVEVVVLVVVLEGNKAHRRGMCCLRIVLIKPVVGTIVDGYCVVVACVDGERRW